MADLNQRSVDSLIDAIENLNKTMGRKSTGRPKTKEDIDPAILAQQEKMKKTQETFRSGVDSAAKSFARGDKELKGMIGGVTKTIAAIKEMNKGVTALSAASITAFGALSAIGNYLADASKIYQELSHSGQVFNGSVIKMSKAAADAALPMEDFAALLKNNAYAATVLTAKGLGDLSKGLRANLHDFSMLNMTTSDLNEYMTGYIETQRSYGILNRLNTVQATESMKNLAVETTRLSQLTGKNRMELMKQTETAMRERTLVSRMMIDAANGIEGLQDSTRSAVNYFAAMPGEAGSILSSALAETVGKGTAEMTNFAQMAAQAGMGEITGMFNKLNAMIQSGTATEEDLEAAREAMTDSIIGNMDSLHYLSSVGNEAASTFVQIGADLQNLRKQRLKELEKADGITAQSMMLEESMKRLSGAIRGSFFGAIDTISEKLAGHDGLATWFTNLTERVVKMANGFGTFMSDLLTEDRINGVMNFIDTLMSGAEKIGSAFSFMVDKLGLFGTALVTATAAFAVKKGVSATKNAIGNALGRDYQIGKARVTTGGAMLVHVTNPMSTGGAGTGGVGGATGGKGKRGIGRGAKLGMAGIATMIAGEVVSNMDDFTGKGAVESGLNIAGMASTGAMLGSVIPGIGTAIGGAIGGIAGTGLEIYQNWDTIAESVGNAMDTVTGSISSIGGFFGDALSSVGDFFIKPAGAQPVIPSPINPSNTPEPVNVNTSNINAAKTNQQTQQDTTSQEALRKEMENMLMEMETGNINMKSGLVEMITIMRQTLQQLKSINFNTED